jgi:hypothetical protein
MMVYRAAVHETTTKVSPNEMMFGHTINLSIYLFIGHSASNYIVPEFSSGYIFSSSKKLEKIHEFARKHIALSSNNMKRLYNRSKHFHSYNAGDAVWFYNPLHTKGLNPKLQRPW